MIFFENETIINYIYTLDDRNMTKSVVHAKSAHQKLKIIYLPMGKQRYDFDCGVAVAWSLLKHKKIKINYESVLQASKVCPVNGLKPSKLITLLGKYGLTAVCETDKNIRFLKEQINNNNPIIVLSQLRKEYKKSWSNTWIYGHYVIVIGYGTNRLVVFDPSWGGSVKIFTHSQFYNRWHDEANGHVFPQSVIYLTD